jgi:hypothetical protein
MTTTVTTQVELDDDARWANWKRDGAKRDLRRKERVRQVIAALCLGAAFWLLLRF